MFCSFSSNCSGSPFNCDWAENITDPDVAGIGVVSAFGITSLITVLCAMPIMLVGMLDLVSSNSIWLQPISRILPRDTSSKALEANPKLFQTIVHITLGLSDQQLVAGLAILITGYTKHCSMKSRHWWVVFDLALFSAVTHLASLPALRTYLAGYPRYRDLRVFLMLCNYFMLLVSAILTFRNYDEATKYCPIRCTFNQIRTKRFGASPIYIAQMVLLTIVFFWQLVMLYTPQEKWNARHAMIILPRKGSLQQTREIEAGLSPQSGEQTSRETPHSTEQTRNEESRGQIGDRNIDRSLSWVYKNPKHPHLSILVNWLFALVFFPPAPIVWLFILAMWILGVQRLAWDMQWAKGDELQWGFGQVLPLLLLVLPILTLVEVKHDDN